MPRLPEGAIMSTLAEEIAAAQAKVAALKVQQAEQEKRERRELGDTLLVLVEERADGPEHHTTATELLTEARRRVRREAEAVRARRRERSEEHTSELQSRGDLVCRLLLANKNRDAGCSICEVQARQTA